jgi:trimeric autotransporter adhesin
MKNVARIGLLLVCVSVLSFVQLAIFAVLRGGTGGAASALKNGDVNGDGALDISDAVYLLSHIFRGGAEPVAFADMTDQQKEILSYMSMFDLPNGKGGTTKTIRLTGVNLQIVNGSGTTESANGLGNLIVGYNRARDSTEVTALGKDDRTGSHNIVVGSADNYTSFGGLVIGAKNSISGTYASVSGGYENVASGGGSSVSGGSGNKATNKGASVSGGGDNVALEAWASVSGGHNNKASGLLASVSGGTGNIASGGDSSVSGGRNNKAQGDYSYVGGGGGDAADSGNVAFAHYSSILGGLGNVAGDPNKTNSNIGDHSTVSGGASNVASGKNSSVTSGTSNTAKGDYSSVTGGWTNTAIGGGSTVSGGSTNKATGDAATVSGGSDNNAEGHWSTVSGACWNDLKGDCAHTP